MAKSASTVGELTVFFDGDDPICRREIALMRRLGGEGVTFCNVARDASLLEGTGLTQAQAIGRFHARTSSGALVSGAEAFRLVWARVPYLRRIARFMHWPGMLPVSERVYRVYLTVKRAVVPRSAP